MKIKLGNFNKEIEPKFNIATSLECTLVWSDSIDDSASMIRINAAACGIALDSFALLPSYKPEKDKILSYGFKILQRLLEKNVPVEEIYQSGTIILSTMSESLPKRQNIDDKKDFFLSPDKET